MQLKIENLTKKYKDKIVLNSINYTFESGKIYGIIGRNGAGKTTFFQSINSDISIDAGKLTLDSFKLSIRDTSLVAAEENIPEFLTAKEFLTFFLKINNKEQEIDHKEIKYYFDIIGLNEQDQNKIMKEYSKGMKNKVELLINIISNKKVLLLDEPLTSLDVIVQEEMKKILRKEKKNRIIMISTHILDIALDLCDEILILNNNKLEKVEKENLNTKKYREKIIDTLKDQKYD